MSEKATDKGDNTAVNYVIYCESVCSAGFEKSNNLSEADYRDASEKTFSFGVGSKIVKPDNAANEQTIKLNGKEYTLQYKETCGTEIASTEKFEKYGKYNTYVKDELHAETRVDTNELLFFCILDQNVYAGSNITENYARAIAKDTISSLYGHLENEYEYDTTVRSNTKTTVVYRKYVWGIPTKDSIQISVNMKGEVTAINAKMLGMFSSAEKDITKEQIDNAIAYLNETFSDVYNLGKIELVIDGEGDYYIRTSLLNKGSNNETNTNKTNENTKVVISEPMRVYINIK